MKGQKKECQFCNKLISVINFNRHKVKHIEHFCCKTCKASFNRKDSLKRHEISQHIYSITNNSALLNFTSDQLSNLGEQNDIDFKKPYTCKVVASRGCGKTTFVLNYIIKIAHANFTDVFIISGTPNQEIYNEVKVIPNVYIKTVDDLDEVVTRGNILIVFDDLLHELRNSCIVQGLNTQGWHKNISVISIEQELLYSNYVERRNSDYFVLLKIRDSNVLNEFYKRFCTDVRHYKFIDLYDSIMDNQGYLIIDFFSKYKYRYNSFNLYYNVADDCIKEIIPADNSIKDELNGMIKNKLENRLPKLCKKERNNAIISLY